MLKLDGSHAERSQLEKMIATLRHRGPDATGVHVAGAAGLAHARLSIIDLEGGNQPMSVADGGLWITFNGEIYNYLELRQELTKKGHRFATRSDTEVILNAYRELGEDCVNHFNGQWAFGIWDAGERKLFLSRDRAGVRPLFYTQTQSSFLFASEVKALFACPEVRREIDPCGMDQIFTFWATVPPRTTFKDVRQLPPGHSLSITDNQLIVKRYWTFPYTGYEARSTRNESAIVEELSHLLADATSIRLRSDVPVGAYLSGGIDSTVITGLIERVGDNRLRSFSIRFQDREFDEGEYQHEASEFLKTQHSEVFCCSADIAEKFPEVVQHTEQPLVRTAPVPMFLLSRSVRQNGFKVVLTGEGADEAFGGYDIFKEAKIRRFWARNPGSLWRPLLLKRLYPYLRDFQRQSPASLRCFFSVTDEDLASPFFSHLPRWALTSKIKLLFSDDFRVAIGKYDAIGELEQTLPSEFGMWPSSVQAEYLEGNYFLPGYLLSSQGDRMAMAHSVEGRYPFLDYRVVKFAAGLPADMKLRVLNEKYVLKQAFKKMIPESILRRRKQPYRAPDSRCFFEPGAPEYVEELLSARAIAKSGIFDSRGVSSLVDRLKSAKAVSVRDDMALIGVLSTQLLATHFLD